ncbi:hypothetical protein [Providencia manganoxydans]|uniref:hypothetical protein n=1 Tax=Providencia manganoxydans TaxID=2923283 RepID=UPI00280F16DB|nr:hypothetical protein [Providencia stuartii]ELR5081279.1 hypothetical protein [Providencia stuartii]
MDIKNSRLENSCNGFINDFSHYFDWNEVDLAFSRIDIERKKINFLSSNYDALLMYWDDDLDLNISERLNCGVQYWSNYTGAFSDMLKKVDKNTLKIDFISQNSCGFEITSINTKRNLLMSDIESIFRCRPIISDYAHQVWKKNPDIALPMRAEISLPTNNFDKKPDEQLINHQHMRFGDIRFTAKEMLTIKLLLSHCRVKEISYIQGCSEMSEHKRIQNIKEKLDCPHASPSGLFKALKEHGVTLACLDTLIDLS